MKYQEATTKGLSKAQEESFKAIGEEFNKQGFAPEEGIELLLAMVSRVMADIGCDKLQFASNGILITASPQSQLSDDGVIIQPEIH
jgi:hypothetical protein